MDIAQLPGPSRARAIARGVLAVLVAPFRLLWELRDVLCPIVMAFCVTMALISLAAISSDHPTVDTRAWGIAALAFASVPGGALLLLVLRWAVKHCVLNPFLCAYRAEMDPVAEQRRCRAETDPLFALLVGME
jgi:hypothetical protein